MRSAGQTDKALLRVLADGIAAWKIDTAAVDATIAQLDAGAAAAHGCSVGALNQLHAILSPAERAVLVDKVQAHWEVWRQVNQGGASADQEHGSRLTALAREVSLTPEQVDRIAKALHASMAGLAEKFEPKQAEAHLQAFTAAFARETFEAKSVTSNANGIVAAQGGRRMAVFYETVLPVLTLEQRARLAMDLREHATHEPLIAER
jgi:Spy/CpxP family protein refolding chaperone